MSLITGFLILSSALLVFLGALLVFSLIKVDHEEQEEPKRPHANGDKFNRDAIRKNIEIAEDFRRK